jgi:hypothetical protein
MLRRLALLFFFLLSLSACAQEKAAVNDNRQLIVFTAPDCGFCAQFKRDIMTDWRAELPIREVVSAQAPTGLTLEKPLFATPGSAFNCSPPNSNALLSSKVRSVLSLAHT